MNFFDWEFAREILPRLLDASLTTIGIALAGFAIAVVLGLFLAIGRRSRHRWLSWPVTGLIEFIRSTPLLIQVYFLFYVFPSYGLNLSAMQAGIIGIALHYACYTAEVYRAGLDAVPRSQWEAVTALNMKPWTAYRDVILPQA
ncbi:MAG TPA: ectoine/hydroxyectoine ABC transporter permease subunit EhuD, partial [Pseudomonas sp.]|nr:ectoine/hydroxyectoine ABC transporter permease subunit EhuD [Pseudomonas sp.]